MINDVAISYDGEEVGRLREVERTLIDAGLSTWSDRQIDEIGPDGLRGRQVMPGSDHWRAIRSAIDHSACLVCLDSEKWRSSDYCQKELGHAELQGKRILAVSDRGHVLAGAAESIPGDDGQALIDAVRRGLRLGRAHARLLVAAEAEASEAIADEGPSQEDLRSLAHADLASLGLALSGAMPRCMARAQRRYRVRARRIRALIGAVLLSLAALAAIALIAREDARRGQSRAAANRDHVESLAIATRSGEATNSIAALELAKRSVVLDVNPETVAALRQALGQLSSGVEIKGLSLSSPTTVAVADDGSLIAESDGDGALALIHTDRPDSTRILSASEVDAGGLLDVSPDNRAVLSVAAEDGSAEVIDVATGQVRTVADTRDVAAVLFVTTNRALTVSHGGEVAEFDPADPHPTAEAVAQLDASVRAATLAGTDSNGEPRLATLLDGAVEVSDLSAPDRPWRVGINVIQGPYQRGWETIRVCGDQLELLTTDRPSGISTAFAIPYTVTAAGAATRTGSLLHSFGLICLPDGHALALDSLYGPHPFPTGGPLLPALTEESAQGSVYALASSDNGQWALASTNDYLKVINLESYGREFEVGSVESLAPAKSGAISLAGSEIASVGRDGLGRRVVSEATGSASTRGAFFDPEVGTVSAIGDQLIAIASRRFRSIADLGAPVHAISPGPGHSAIVLFAGGRVAIVPLDPGNGRRREVVLPADLWADNAFPVAVLKGPSRRTLLVAATNGRLDLLRIGDGGELRSIQLHSGPIDLVSVSDAGFLAATSDGVLSLLDPATLALRRSQKVLPAGPSLVVSDPTGELAAAFGVDGEAAVVTVPDLGVVTHPAVAPGLRSVVFADHGGELFLGADVPYVDGTHQASITEWPICRLCLGRAAELEGVARDPAGIQPTAGRPTFDPAGPRLSIAE